MAEKNKIVKKIAQGMSTLEIFRQLSRVHRTMKKMAEFGIQPRNKNQSEFRTLKARNLSHIGQEVDQKIAMYPVRTFLNPVVLTM